MSSTLARKLLVVHRNTVTRRRAIPNVLRAKLPRPTLALKLLRLNDDAETRRPCEDRLRPLERLLCSCGGIVDSCAFMTREFSGVQLLFRYRLVIRISSTLAFMGADGGVLAS